MVYTRDVRLQVQRYLDGALSLRDLALWLAEEGWELRDSGSDSPALDAIRALDLCFGEYTGKHITRERLAERFREVLDTLPLSETTRTVISEPTPRSSTVARTEFARASA